MKILIACELGKTEYINSGVIIFYDITFRF